MKSASDIWVCSRCRSINPLSRGKCYRCNTPIEVAAAKPEELSFAHREVPPEPIGRCSVTGGMAARLPR